MLSKMGMILWAQGITNFALLCRGLLVTWWPQPCLCLCLVPWESGPISHHRSVSVTDRSWSTDGLGHVDIGATFYRAINRQWGITQFPFLKYKLMLTKLTCWWIQHLMIIITHTDIILDTAVPLGLEEPIEGPAPLKFRN